MLLINNISFSYMDGNMILDNTTLNIEKEKITVILGKNGVGKTTLLRLMNGLLIPKTGEINFKDKCIFVSDTPYFYDYLTGNEYLDLISSLCKKNNLDSLETFICDLDLETGMNKLISTYSLGMKHKLALLTALVLDFNIYLIDEPLASLDPDSQKFMISFFKYMRDNGKTLIISTHMLHVAYQLSDDIIFFKEKKLESFKNTYSSFEEFEEFVIKKISI